MGTMIAASKRGLHGFPLSSCTCHYGITPLPPSPLNFAAQRKTSKIPSCEELVWSYLGQGGVGGCGAQIKLSVGVWQFRVCGF